MHALITFIAKYFIFLSIIGTLIVWLRLDTAQKKRFILLAIGGGILTLILAKVGSHIFYDTRPFIAGHFIPYFGHPSDNGFPSDHTLLASFLAFLAWQYSRKAGLVLLVIAILIGLSRVIAGVHHLVDIIGSIVFALLGVVIVALIARRTDSRHSNHSSPEAKV